MSLCLSCQSRSRSLWVCFSCGSVIGVLEMTSKGFYDVSIMQELILTALTTGRLGSLGVSPMGSSIQAITCEYKIYA